MEDEEILDLITGSATAEKGFSLLVKKYQQRLYQQIRRMLFTHDDTDEVLQLVFIKSWRNIHSFRRESKLYTWLCRIAINESITYLNNRKKRFFVPADDLGNALSDSDNQWADVTGDLIQKKLIMAMSGLPDKQRAVFNLRYFEEMSYEDISRITGTSVGALKASYHHAVQKIEKYINEN